MKTDSTIICTIHDATSAELELARAGFYRSGYEKISIDNPSKEETLRGEIYTYARNQVAKVNIEGNTILVTCPPEDLLLLSPEDTISINTFEGTTTFRSHTGETLLFDFEMQAVQDRLQELGVIERH